MDDLLIDGKIFDKDTFEEKEFSSETVNHEHEINVDLDNDTYIVEVVRDDGRSWVWSLQSNRINDLVDNLNTLGEMSDSVEGLRADLFALSDITQNSLLELQEIVDAPADFYEFSSDVFTQILFFVSLIFGVLVFVVFSLPFRK